MIWPAQEAIAVDDSDCDDATAAELVKQRTFISQEMQQELQQQVIVLMVSHMITNLGLFKPVII